MDVPPRPTPSRRWWAWFAITGLVISRFIAVPDGPWEQDEAIFAAGVLSPDVVAHRPHPPGFPGWIALGRLVNLLLDDALWSLRCISALSSAAIGWMVWKLLTPRLGPWVAALSSAALMCTPLVWIHAPRGFTTTPAVACLLGACVAWGWRIPEPDEPRPYANIHRARMMVGWSLIALTVCIRPQLAPQAVLLASVRAVQMRHAWRSEILGPLVAAGICAASYGWIIMASGGWSPYLDACSAHLSDHARSAGGPDGVSKLGITRALGGTTPTILLGLAAVAGCLGLRRAARPAAAVLLTMALLTAATVLLAHHPGFPRYAVSLGVALWIPAALLMEHLPRMVGGSVMLAGAAGWSSLTVPAAEAMHLQPLPPVEVVRTISSAPAPSVAYSHGLFSFVRLEALEGRLPDTTLLDMHHPGHAVRLPPGSWSLLGRGIRALPGTTVCTVESAPFPSAARTLSQDRFTRATARRDAVLLGPGHHQLETTDTGLPFVWWSQEVQLFPPEKGRHLWLSLAVDAAHADNPWQATCDGRPVGDGVLQRGRQTLSLDIQGCEGPVAIAMARGFSTQRDGRTLTAKLLSAWVTGPDFTIPAQRFSPGDPASMLASGVVTGGVYGPERFGGQRAGAWTGPRATLRFPASPGTLTLTLARPPHSAGDVVVRVGSQVRSLDVGRTPTAFEIPLPTLDGTVAVEIESPSFVPRTINPDSGDTRALGLIIFDVATRPSVEATPCPGTAPVATSRRD